MHSMLFRRALLALFIAIVPLAMASGQAPPQRNTGPWDVPALLKPTPATWGEKQDLVQEVWYESEPWHGKTTRVFAYYGRPKSGDGPFPAMLLVHGGGGKAFREWAALWAERGYVALAMDTAGHGPDGQRLPDGGPDQNDAGKFGDFDDSGVREMWTYHAVAAVLRGHALLASRPEVDRQKIGITGISWGGYLTCIVSGIDDQLQAAVPVYGCGFLGDNSAWLDRFAKMPSEQRERWLKYFDPSHYLPGASCPMLFVNGTNDFAYPLDSYQKSYRLVTTPVELCIRVRMPHGHSQGWAPSEIGWFIESHVKGGDSLPHIGAMQTTGDTVTAPFTSKTPLAEAQLHYTSDTGAWQQRKWTTVAATLGEKEVQAKLPAERPLVYYLSITDQRGALVSAPHAELAAGQTSAVGPMPKEGLLVPKARASETRQWVLSLRDEPLLDGKQGIRTIADRTVAEWPKVRAAVEPHVPQMLDLWYQSNKKDVTSAEVRDAAEDLDEAFDALAFLGFMYFVTAEQKYADTAYEILDLAGRTPRWGWFNWDGANMPQIHYGQITRTAAFCVDFCWDGWNKEQQRRAVEIVAEKGVESYWRIVSLAPFMALHHLRAKNQGNNALSAALIASIVVGDSVPQNQVWLKSLLQTYSWVIAHDIGWAGTNLESGIDGYWNVSMQNLYTAAVSLVNARGIDLRVHPSFAEAAWYPIMHEATVGRPHGGAFNKPYAKNEVGLWGMIEHKPLELPMPAGGGAWWYDFATQFPESPATYFIARTAGRKLGAGHQRGHAEILNLLWVARTKPPVDAPGPTQLFKATDREAMIRSGYGSPHTFLSFNGDLFLSARNEVLGCTSGLAWHYPWHQYAVTESVLETEGLPFSPSMLIYESFDSPIGSLLRTRSAESNVKYYRRPQQARSHLDYRKRNRDILYVRSDRPDESHDYFVFVDRVQHEEPKWHAFNWHIWNQPGNEGRYEKLDDRSVLARRPNASLLLATLSHDRMTYEEQAIPSQPPVSYVFDHNARLLRAIAGGSETVDAPPVILPARLWSQAEHVQLDGRDAALVSDPLDKSPQFQAPLKLVPGSRYEVQLAAQKEAARIYENFAWTIDLKLLDAAGKVLLDTSDAVEHRAPSPLRLTDPASNEATYRDWRTTTSHFTAPAGVAMVEATLRPAKYGHATKLTPESKFWLGDLTLRPLGVPQRTTDDLLVTLVMPLENSMSPPKYRSQRVGDRVEAEITHPSGARDRLVITRDGQINCERHQATQHWALGASVTKLAVGDLTSQAPVNAALTEQEGRVTGNLATAAKTQVTIGGQSQTVDAGIYLYDGTLKPNLAAESLRTNTAISQKRLQAGLKPLADAARDERDRYVRQGWKNVALDAQVQASATRDPRFDARNLIDNKTWEMPFDGVVDYTLGDLLTMGNGGYGRDAASYENDLVTWPLYFRPTYWLLPLRQTGDVVIRLKELTAVRMVRLMNTTNAGLNDFATTDARIELLGSQGDEVLWSQPVQFGRTWDRVFKSAFVRPDFFASYGDSFRGMLEPGVRVPFGEGWVDVPVDCDRPAARVRIRVDKFWAGGGGLNEVQVYAR